MAKFVAFKQGLNSTRFGDTSRDGIAVSPLAFDADLMNPGTLQDCFYLFSPDTFYSTFLPSHKLEDLSDSYRAFVFFENLEDKL